MIVFCDNERLKTEKTAVISVNKPKNSVFIDVHS